MWHFLKEKSLWSFGGNLFERFGLAAGRFGFGGIGMDGFYVDGCSFLIDHGCYGLMVLAYGQRAMSGWRAMGSL